MIYLRLSVVLFASILFACGSGSMDASENKLAIRQVQAPQVYIGEYHWEAGEGIFRICRTGKEFAVVGGKAEKQLNRTLYSINPGKPIQALVELEGYLAQQLEPDSGWTAPVFMVDRLIDLDVQQSCGDIGVPITQDSLFQRITQEIELLSQMYLEEPLKADALSPETPLSSFLLSEPMQLGFWAFIMSETGMSQQQMIQVSDSLGTVLDVYQKIEGARGQK
ncbi:MAG: hypothetical protein AAF694_21840 [Bacteroidota bacterium]